MAEISSYCSMHVRWCYGRNLNGLGLSTCVIQWRRKVCKPHYVSIQVLLNYLVTKMPVCNDGSQNKFLSLSLVLCLIQRLLFQWRATRHGSKPRCLALLSRLYETCKWICLSTMSNASLRGSDFSLLRICSLFPSGFPVHRATYDRYFVLVQTFQPIKAPSRRMTLHRRGGKMVSAYCVSRASKFLFSLYFVL